MSDDDEGGGGGGGGDDWADDDASKYNEADLYGYLENGEENADYNQVHQALAFQAKRRAKRPVDAQLREEAQAKHSKAEADQLFPWREDHPQDPRIMGVDYVVTNDVTYYCSVNLWVLLYRQAQTGQAVM